MANVIGYITAKDKKEAQKIADALLRKRLIACANIIGGIDSAYWWKGKIEKQREALLFVKTRKALAGKIIEEVEKLHSYELPCIEFIEVKAGNKEYVQWVEKEASGKI